MKTPEVTRSAPPTLALTRKKAAAALGVSAMTVDRLTRRGLLIPSRATRRPLYALNELERFLKDTKAGPRAASTKLSSTPGACAPEQGEGKQP
jgi:hypothetical protein